MLHFDDSVFALQPMPIVLRNVVATTVPTFELGFLRTICFSTTVSSRHVPILQPIMGLHTGNVKKQNLAVEFDVRKDIQRQRHNSCDPRPMIPCPLPPAARLLLVQAKTHGGKQNDGNMNAEELHDLSEEHFRVQSAPACTIIGRIVQNQVGQPLIPPLKIFEFPADKFVSISSRLC